MKITEWEKYLQYAYLRNDLQAEYIEDFYNSIMKWETTH